MKKTAPNTVILPLLLTSVCRTVILMKILWSSSLCGEQMLFLSLLRRGSHSLVWSKPSPRLKALATYRKTSTSQVGAGWELCCIMYQLPFLQPRKTICSLQLWVVNEPQLYWWLRVKEGHKCYQNLVKVLCRGNHPVAALCALLPLTSWPGPLKLLQLQLSGNRWPLAESREVAGNPN